ncbi:MAG TPA: dTDP-4-dehydrorhamnose reductase [Actinomycetota bacterium]|nr:dTDP-4-dehydrorhamnose reductase [Actinomycetota bacterium]
MKVLVTGAGGLLGRETVAAFGRAGHDATGVGRDEMDVSDREQVLRVVSEHAPALVVHPAALTEVDVCEREPDRAFAVNAEGSRHVAEAAREVGADLVLVSTDYVFDGSKGAPYVEGDTPNPLQVYGRSKLAGEEAVRTVWDRHWVVRSAWIYGPGGKNFISKLPALAAAGAELSAVADQTGSPTYAQDLAEALVVMCRIRPPYGTYHLTNSGVCTFAELVNHAVRSTGLAVAVKEVSWRDLGRPAVRPGFTALENEAWARAGLEPLRDWRQAVEAFVRGS